MGLANNTQAHNTIQYTTQNENSHEAQKQATSSPLHPSIHPSIHTNHPSPPSSSPPSHPSIHPSNQSNLHPSHPPTTSSVSNQPTAPHTTPLHHITSKTPKPDMQVRNICSNRSAYECTITTATTMDEWPCRSPSFPRDSIISCQVELSRVEAASWLAAHIHTIYKTRQAARWLSQPE